MYIIIGQGAAGYSAAQTLRRLDRKLAITMITDEKDFFYSRIDLPDIIKGKIALDDAPVVTADRFAELGIVCRMGETVARILPQEKAVELASGERLGYAKLLLATGSKPILPPIPGSNARGVHILWTLADARSIMESCATARSAVVIGAGLIGLKTAQALKARGLDVTVIERLPGVMPRQLDTTASDLLRARLLDEDIHVLTDTCVDEILTENGAVTGVLAGARLACELVVSAVGVRPDTRLAREAGLHVEQGIVVDAAQRTSDPSIFAAGDVAQTVDALTGAAVIPAIWPVAVAQGRVAAYNMKGRPLKSDPCLAMNSVEIGGLPLVSFGDINGEPGDDIQTSHQGTTYRKLVRRGETLRGALCLGDIRQAGVLGNMVLQQMPIGRANPMSPRFNAVDLIPGTGL